MKTFLTVEYMDHNGSFVSAKSCSHALCIWLFKSKISDRNFACKIIENAPYSKQFILSVVSQVESKFGKAPKINLDLLKKEWYDASMMDLHNKTTQDGDAELVRAKMHKYEAWCQEVLEWLSVFGDIKQIQFHS